MLEFGAYMLRVNGQDSVILSSNNVHSLHMAVTRNVPFLGLVDPCIVNNC